MRQSHVTHCQRRHRSDSMMMAGRSVARHTPRHPCPPCRARQKLRWQVESICSRRWEMHRRIKRECATSSADAPPPKKSVATKPGANKADTESPLGPVHQPRRSGRLEAAAQQPLPCAQSQAVKKETKSCKDDDALPLTSAAALPRAPNPNMNCRPAVDEFCPVSISTHV